MRLSVQTTVTTIIPANSPTSRLARRNSPSLCLSDPTMTALIHFRLSVVGATAGARHGVRQVKIDCVTFTTGEFSWT